MDIQTLLNKIDRYCELTGKNPSTVATNVAGTGLFFERLKNGGDCTTKTYNRVNAWLDANMPAEEKPKQDDNNLQ